MKFARIIWIASAFIFVFAIALNPLADSSRAEPGNSVPVAVSELLPPVIEGSENCPTVARDDLRVDGNPISEKSIAPGEFLHITVGQCEIGIFVSESLPDGVQSLRYIIESDAGEIEREIGTEIDTKEDYHSSIGIPVSVAKASGDTEAYAVFECWEEDNPGILLNGVSQFTWFTYTGTSGEMDVWGPHPHSSVVTLGPYLGSGWQEDSLPTLDYTNFLPQFDIMNSKRHQSFIRSGQYDWIEHHCASAGYYWGVVGGTGWYYGSRCLGCRIGYHIIIAFP